MKTGLTVKSDKSAELVKSLNLLAQTRVMVGVPAAEALKRPDDAASKSPINNAALAYIHTHGAPEAGIPPRPFLAPGLMEQKTRLLAELRVAGQIALAGRPDALERQFHRIGMIARDAVKMKIGSNIPPPLALSTVQGRIRRRKSLQWRAGKRKKVAANMGAGRAPGAGLFVSLIDTGALRNSLNYVLRKVRGL